MVDNPDWWKDLPCHLNPDWKLHQQSNLDVRKLKHQVEDDLRIHPEFMTVENLLYQAFLEMAPTSFLRSEQPSPQKALRFLKKAEEFITTDETTKDDADAKNGYKIVINSFRMWIYKKSGSFVDRKKTENLLKKLHSSKSENSDAFVKATRALALSRLGFERCQEAMQLFEMALEQCQSSSNIHWMFGRAIMQGRLARGAITPKYGNRNLDENSKKAFEREKELLEEVISKDPTFAWPIAYLGQCFYNLKKDNEAVRCLEQAMSTDTRNTDIALISARVYKWIEQALKKEEKEKKLPDKLFSKSEEILKRLPEDSQTSEVFLQLGLIYKERAKEISFCPPGKCNWDKEKEWKQSMKNAMENMEKALEKDTCHIVAAIKIAELLALNGENDKAKDAYLDLIHREDIHPLNQFHILKSANLKVSRKVFDKPEVLDNIFRMMDFCIKNFTKFDENGVGTFENNEKEDAEASLEELKSMSMDKNSKLNILAKNYLVQVLRRLGKYEDGKQVILSLIENQPDNVVELRWNLGKCYCGLGELDKAEKEAESIQELPPKQDFQADEIYADVYLARSKDKRKSKDCKSVIENLHEAIKKGSLEACNLYLEKVKQPQERLRSLDESIVQIILEIRACLERSNTFHHKFDGSTDDPFSSIKKKITTILVYPPLPDKIYQVRYDFMSDIRASLIDFEWCYLQACGSGKTWNTACQQAATKVLSDARELLDHVIFDYQKKFRKKSGDPPKTLFPISMDFTMAEVNKDKAKAFLSDWLRRFLPGHTMSEEMFTFFMQLQPRYSEENRWLAVLHDFVGKKKHTGSDKDGDTYSICDGKISCNKAVLVRTSCYKVERIAEKILRPIQIGTLSNRTTYHRPLRT